MAALTEIDPGAQPGYTDIGAQPEAVAASVGGDTFVNNGAVGLWVDNQGGAKSITLSAVLACDHGFTHDAVIPVGAGETGFIAYPKQLLANRFNADANVVSVTYDDVTSLAVAVVRMA